MYIFLPAGLGHRMEVKMKVRAFCLSVCWSFSSEAHALACRELSIVDLVWCVLRGFALFKFEDCRP